MVIKDFSMKSLSGKDSILNYENWLKIKEGSLTGKPCSSNGFHFMIKDGSVSIFNGSEYKEFDLPPVLFFVCDDLNNVKKTLRDKRFTVLNDIFKEIKLLKISFDNFIDLIFYYSIKLSTEKNSNLILYVNADISNDAIENISFFNFAYIKINNENKKPFFINVQTVTENSNMKKSLQDFKISSREYFNQNYNFSC